MEIYLLELKMKLQPEKENPINEEDRRKLGKSDFQLPITRSELRALSIEHHKTHFQDKAFLLAIPKICEI